MAKHVFVDFVNRCDAVELFHYVREYGRRISSSLFPILTFVGPPGSGKSALLQHLSSRETFLKEKKAIQSYAYLDFSQTGAPCNIPDILVALRDQLWQSRARDLHHFVFPRFDLAWLLLSSAARTRNLHALDEVPAEIHEFLARFGKYGEINGKLADIAQARSSSNDILQALMHEKTYQDFVAHLATSSSWHWYRTCFMLEENASIQTVLHYFYDFLLDKDESIEQILAAAFLADLREILENSSPIFRGGMQHIVLFLDAFERLLEPSNDLGRRLLELLAFTSTHGETNPLFLVLGSRQRLYEERPGMDTQSIERLEIFQRRQTPQQYVRDLYGYWLRQLPLRSKALELRNLYLEFSLLDFSPEDIDVYLQSYNRAGHTISLTDRLIADITRATHGHPLALHQVAEALSLAQQQEQVLLPNELEHVALTNSLKQEFLAPLSSTEQQELMLYAMPRTLPVDLEALRALLQLAPDPEAARRWQHYRALALLSYQNASSVLLHPLVRKIALEAIDTNRLVSSAWQEQYTRIHTLLQSSFHERACEGEKAAFREEAYHALALGNAQLAIDLARSLYTSVLDEQWDALLETVAEAPIALLPPQTATIAVEALAQAQKTGSTEKALEALVLFTWLLSSSYEKNDTFAHRLHCLGLVYSLLPDFEREKNVRKAIDYYTTALELCSREHRPLQWAEIQQSLGVAYYGLTSRDRQEHLERAIHYYEQALSVFTKEETPSQWAQAIHFLGRAYFYFPGTISEHQMYWSKAIMCYQAALATYRHSSIEWATVQRDLGNAYLHYPGHEDRQEMLQQAVSCYEAALRIYTRRDYPAEWALLEKDKEGALIAMARAGQETYLPVASIIFTGEPAIIISEAPVPDPVMISPANTSAESEKAGAIPSGVGEGPLSPPARTHIQKRRHKPLGILFASLSCIVAVLLLYVVLVPRPSPAPPNYIGVHQAKNKEYVGISDGHFVFDTYNDRKSTAIYLKEQAARKLQSGAVQDAEHLWQAALAIDPTDAETRIYLEDQRVLDTGLPYVTIFVGVSLGGGNYAYSSREILQGAYIEQYEWNLQHRHGFLLRLLIANSGSDATNAKAVAQQIVQQYRVDATTVAVMGWSSSSHTLNAINVLNTSHILVLSQMSSVDSLSGINPDFFRIVPTNQTQATQGAIYATTKYHHVAIFENPADIYSQNLAQDFASSFRSHGGSIVVSEAYSPAKPQDFPGLLSQALTHRPDLIYFAGNSPELRQFLAILPSKGPFATLRVMTGDAAYALVSYPNQQKNNIHRLFFTSDAHPDSWDWLDPSKRKPAFFTDYPHVFGSGATQSNVYGSTRAGAYTILSYDAMNLLLTVVQQAFAQKKSPRTTPILQQELEQITMLHPVQGVGGVIAFDAKHDAVDKALVIVNSDALGSLRIESIEGCFFLPCKN